ncbi:hypothetical protein RD792_017944 [Penstemon davidsonii]|uniref:NAB domain-containing protein n=1 Tax=Penstemon davidsonii TaxID=160366 RepID=A0ABR0DVG3_9LAMI|nr:hypothetical protein RD792_017944 [Penstemon davidsonii]
MLQRAASNAYSWWWASHIRTKQSKWLDQSLQGMLLIGFVEIGCIVFSLDWILDMEEKVHGMLKLIEEDGDSFAKRAEMYYKRRPELINSVEESYKAFRALADRYDLLSKELQNANHTIATVFPDQVQFMEDDDDAPTPRIPKNIPSLDKANIPKVPKAPNKDLKGLLASASKQIQAKKASKAQKQTKFVEKSGLNKDEALEEIDKLQKDILALQTMKEFVKSSYESGLSKYWGIENQIIDMQQKVCRLQDEFNVDKVIEDDVARTLMAEAALKSCHETLSQLQEKHERFTKEAMEEYKKIEDVRSRLKSFKKEYLHESEDDQGEVIQETNNEIEPLPEKLDLSFMASSLTVTELAEKIDQLVNKVISLESAVSSQTLLINTFRTEANELHPQIQNLEDEKDILVHDNQNLRTRVKGFEEKLTKIQNLNKNRERQNNNLRMNFAEARSSLDHLSEKLSSVKPDEETDEAETETDSSSQYEIISPLHENLENTKDGGKNFDSSKTDDQGPDPGPNTGTNTCSVPGSDTCSIPCSDPASVPGSDPCSVPGSAQASDPCSDPGSVPGSAQASDPCSDPGSVPGSAQTSDPCSDPGSDPTLVKQEVQKKHKRSVEMLDPKIEVELPVGHPDYDPVNGEGDMEKNEDENWQHMLLSGMEDREKILLKEYTEILRNYKEVKKKLSDKEKIERDSQFDITVQMRELKKAILKRDEEIQHLKQKLNISEEDVKPEQGSEDFDVNEEDEIKLVYINRPTLISIVEEKLRMDIDAILDENLDFWLRFSTAFHQIQKFKTEVQDLQGEIVKLKEKKKQEGSATTRIKSEVRPIYKHLREIQNELTVWLEQSVSLKDELKRRFASLCNIQEEITKALKDGVEEDEIRFSSHQAAKFQGEILNMKQENNKVREELEAGLDHVSSLQLEIEKTLRRLNEEFGISSDQAELKNSMSRARVPLHSFIFGTKPKKQKNSIFSCMHPNRSGKLLQLLDALSL